VIMSKSNKTIPVRKYITRAGKSFVTTVYISPEQAEKLKKKTSVTTQDKYKDKNGHYDKSRQQIHEKIVSQLVDSCPKPKPGEKPKAVLLLGGAASGKTTVVNKFVKPKMGDDFGALNVDDIKEQLPEYSKYAKQDVKTAANRVHGESSDLGKRVTKQVIDEGRNFIFDAVLADPEKAKKLIKDLKAKGYEVSLVGVNVDAEDALSRARLRAFGDKERVGSETPKEGEKGGSGRYVPDKILLNGHKGASNTFEQIKDEVDSYELYDNNVAFGEDPIKVVDNNEVYHKDKYDSFKNKVHLDADKLAIEKAVSIVMSEKNKTFDAENLVIFEASKLK
jgi:predicted ABC-type ATPase